MSFLSWFLNSIHAIFPGSNSISVCHFEICWHLFIYLFHYFYVSAQNLVWIIDHMSRRYLKSLKIVPPSIPSIPNTFQKYCPNVVSSHVLVNADSNNISFIILCNFACPPFWSIYSKYNLSTNLTYVNRPIYTPSTNLVKFWPKLNETDHWYYNIWDIQYGSSTKERPRVGKSHCLVFDWNFKKHFLRACSRTHICSPGLTKHIPSFIMFRNARDLNLHIVKENFPLRVELILLVRRWEYFVKCLQLC